MEPVSPGVRISKDLVRRMRDAKHVSALTGAGISAESGVPTFRGNDGLWNKFKPEELANLDAFMANPDLVWEWYQYRRRLIEEVSPNPGHLALAEMEKFFPAFLLSTQNVDGLHQRAGSENMVELHGNILRNRCVDCESVVTDIPGLKEQTVPRCNCGGLIRPDVVWFGEILPEKPMRTARAAAEGCDLFFSIGTSALVYPAASLPEMAKQNGAFLVEINIEPSAISAYADELIIAKSGEALPALMAELVN